MGLINGQKGAFLQPPKYGRDSSGLYGIYTWHGTKNECLANIPAIEAGKGLWEMQESFTNARCELTARFPNNPGAGEEVPENTWELHSTEQEKDILDSDNRIAGLLTFKEKRLLRKVLNNQGTGAEGTDPAWLGDEDVRPIAIDLYYRIRDGLRSVRLDVPLLRNTLLVSRNYTIPNLNANARKLFKTSTLLTQESIPADIAGNMPNEVYTIDEAGSGGYTKAYGWMQKRPQITTAARQRTRLVREWEYGLWPIRPAIYGLVT